MVSSIGFFTLPQVAEALLCSKTTVRRLVRAGLLRPRYQILSGRCYRLVFEPAELIRFQKEHYPRPEDLGPNVPRGVKGQAEMIRRLQNFHKLSIGRVNALRAAKECGPKAEEEEPVIVDEKPRRQRNRQEGKDEAEDEWSPWSPRGNRQEEES
ncbi:MAG: helix-turn-helix domain-containing protein [Candidatus Binatia bacterium]